MVSLLRIAISGRDLYGEYLLSLANGLGEHFLIGNAQPRGYSDSSKDAVAQRQKPWNRLEASAPPKPPRMRALGYLRTAEYALMDWLDFRLTEWKERAFEPLGFR